LVYFPLRFANETSFAKCRFRFTGDRLMHCRFEAELRQVLFKNLKFRCQELPINRKRFPSGVEMESRISMICLGVADLERSVEFYEKGLKLCRKPFDGPVAFFNLDGTWLSVFERESLARDAGVSGEGSGFSGITLAHNVTSEDKVKEALLEAEAAGAAIVKPAQKADWGGFHGYFSDPDGHLWEVAFNPFGWIGPPAGA
jgi:hypothetical protein